MFPQISPIQTEAWKDLQDHYDREMRKTSLKELFLSDPDRFTKFSVDAGDLLFDYSKNILKESTLALLLKLATETRLREAIDAMFSGEKINRTENRSVLHTALRNFSGKPVLSDGPHECIQQKNPQG